MQISEYGQLAGAVRGGGMQGDKAEEGGRAESWWLVSLMQEFRFDP